MLWTRGLPAEAEAYWETYYNLYGVLSLRLYSLLSANNIEEGD